MGIKRIFHDPIHKEIVFDAGKAEEWVLFSHQILTLIWLEKMQMKLLVK